mmetsp:Transcript_18951/g.26121  ORF Transcript_18951/g.26121 Transcript_18951/m.26121 type:complete len:116 (+) Transcript_18951:62-409(+)
MSSSDPVLAHLPRNTIVGSVKGKKSYTYKVMVDNTLFQFAMLKDGAEYDVYLLTPVLKDNPEFWRPKHSTHMLGGGKLCIPRDSAKKAYGNSVGWAAAYMEYTRGDKQAFYKLFK